MSSETSPPSTGGGESARKTCPVLRHLDGAPALEMKKLIRLHPKDPIGIALVALTAGERVVAETDTVCLPAGIAPGHKVALRAIAAGEQVLRNAVGIGSATRDIAPGEHVHLHNLKSDYIPTLNRHYQDRQGSS